MTVWRLRPNYRMVISATVVLTALSIYGYGFMSAWNERNTAAVQNAYLDTIIANAGAEESNTRALAEAYWNRYPDVAEDNFFGRHGKLGVAGARSHFQRHGRQEGRKWGVD